MPATLSVNKRVRDIVGSTTLAITARAKELIDQGYDVVNFAAGEPDFDTPEEIKAAAIKAMQKGFTKYTPTIGTWELREAIARKFRKDNRLTYQPSQIAVCCGAKHAIYNVVQVLVDEDDEVILPAPYWVSYPEMVKCAGARVKVLETTAETQFKITADQLKTYLSPQTKLLILSSPSNPTGMVYTKEELTALAEVCVDHQIYVISDEIYEKLLYDLPAYISLASLGLEIYRLTITVNGVSKAYSMTGWRIGYCAGDPEIINYINKFQDHSTSNPCSISQAAALQALNSSEENIQAMCDEFHKRRDVMMAALKEIKEIKFIPPQGAFYLFCDVSALGDSQMVAKKILDEVNVALIPGDGFGAPGFVRLSFATSMERIQEGTRRIKEWVKKYGHKRSA